MFADTTFHHEASGADLARPVERPDIEDAAEVFALIERREPVGLGTFDKGRESQFTGYVRLPSYKSGNAQLAEWALHVLKANIFADLRMDLQVVVHDNGWSLIIAEYSQIIGSIWLAYVRTESLPNPD